jgi:hypothetical protein
VRKTEKAFQSAKEGRMNASQESSQPATLSDQAKDFAKQLVTYADAITAFAVVQLLSFIYLLARGDCFTVNVLNHLCLPIVGSIIVSGAYGILVILCHVGESHIFKDFRDPKVARPATGAWIARYVIILLALVATVEVLRQVKHDMKSHDFLTDCKDSKTEKLTHTCCAPCSTDHHE